MGWLDRLRGRSSSRIQKPTAVPAEKAACAHVTLLGRWDSTADMGNEDKASSWVCDVCGAAFERARCEPVSTH
jgi:hypothetical protein